MKKILSTVAMAIVAIAAVVSMSSCSNDDASSMNAAPQVTAQPRTNVYEYNAKVSSDILTYFDVVITRTDGTASQTVAFTNSTKLYDKAASQATDGYTSQSVNVKYDVKVTPKANWQELLKANNTDKIYVAMSVEYSFNSCKVTASDGLYGHYYDADSDASMQGMAMAIADVLKTTNI